MRGLDDTDRQILQLLLEDGRRPFSDVAERVDLSPPAVSDRVDRLQDLGVVRRFTVDVDRNLLSQGTPVLVTVTATPGSGAAVADALAAMDAVEHVFRTADDRVVATATLPPGQADDLVGQALDPETVRDVDVRLEAGRSWEPSVEGAMLTPTCAECGNSVDSEGASADLGGDVYYFCCDSCQDNFTERFEELAEGAAD